MSQSAGEGARAATAFSGLTIAEDAPSGENNSNVGANKVVSAVQIREEYVERLQEMVTSAVWQRLKPELADLLDMVRLTTVEVVEAVCDWRRGSSSCLPFVWSGRNVILALASDLDFMAGRPELRKWMAIPSLRRNPFVQLQSLKAIACAPERRPRSLGVAAASYPMATRVDAASWLILDEEEIHGRLVVSTEADVRKKLQPFADHVQSRQFLRRSDWSTRPQFERLLRQRRVELRPVEMEWLLGRVKHPQGNQRVDHRALWAFLTNRKSKRAKKRHEKAKRAIKGRGKKSSYRRLDPVKILQPKWVAQQSQHQVRQAAESLKRLTKAMAATEIEIGRLESMLANGGAATMLGGMGQSSMGRSGQVAAAHEVTWHRNQLFKRKIDLESKRDLLELKREATAQKMRQFGVNVALTAATLRDQRAIAARVRKGLVAAAAQYQANKLDGSGGDGSPSMSASQKLQRFRRAEEQRQQKLREAEEQSRMKSKRGEVAARRREERKVACRTFRYKQFRESLREIKQRGPTTVHLKASSPPRPAVPQASLADVAHRKFGASTAATLAAEGSPLLLPSLRPASSGPGPGPAAPSVGARRCKMESRIDRMEGDAIGAEVPAPLEMDSQPSRKAVKMPGGGLMVLLEKGPRRSASIASEAAQDDDGARGNSTSGEAAEIIGS